MERLTTDWDPRAFPRLLEEELDRANHNLKQFTPWMNVAFIGVFGFLGIKLYHDVRGLTPDVMDYVLILTPLLLLGLVLVRMEINALERYGREVAERIIHSGLLAGLPQAGDWLGGIYDWTPTGFARIFVGRCPTDMKSWGRVLVWNLDWYMDAPRRYVRPEWYLVIVMTVVGVLLIVFYPSKPDLVFIQTMGLIGIPVVLVPLAFALYINMKKCRMMEVFRELLNNRYLQES